MARQIKTELVVKDKGSKTIKKFSNTTMGLMKKLAGPLAIGAVTAGFTALIKRQIDYGDALQKTGIRIGANVTQLDKLRKVAEFSGVQFNTLTMAMQRATRRIQEVAETGGGVAASALQRLGLEATKIAKLGADEQFRIIASQLGKVSDSGERVALAFKLFDSEGVRVLQMTKDLNKQLAETNSNWDQSKVDQAAAFNDQMTAFKQSMQDFAVNVLPIVTKGMQSLTTATKFYAEALRDKSPLEQYQKSLQSLNRKMSENAAEQKEIQDRLNNPTMFDKATFASARLNERLNVLKEEFARNKQGADVLQAAIDKLTDSVNKAGSTTGITPTAETPLGKKATSLMNKTSMKSETIVGDYELDKAKQRMEEWVEAERQKQEQLKTLRDQQFAWAEDYDSRERNRRSTAIKSLIDIEKNAAEERKALADRTKEFMATSIGDAFGDMITGAKNAKDAFADFARSVISDMAKMAAKKAMMMMFSNMGGGGIFGALGSILGLAGGGNMTAGRPYIVGENGPELVVGQKDRKVIPNNQLGGSNVAVSVNVDASNSNVGQPEEANKLGITIGKIVEQNVKNVLMKEKRYGGILSPQRRFA